MLWFTLIGSPCAEAAFFLFHEKANFVDDGVEMQRQSTFP
jgi:hypothetical protein